MDPGLLDALQRSSSSRNRRHVRSFASFSGGIADAVVSDQDSWVNKSDLLCPRDGCGSVIVKQGVAKHIERSSVQMEPSERPPHPLLPSLPIAPETAQWWLITPSPMAFENIGFSHAVTSQVETTDKKLKLLACAECDLGPLGWCEEGGTEFWLACSRVGGHRSLYFNGLSRDKGDRVVVRTCAALGLEQLCTKTVGLLPTVMAPFDSSPALLNKTVISYIESLRLAWEVPGLAIGIVRPDGLTETHGWGIKNALGDPVTAETLFGIASCTKAFLSTAIGVILEKSKEDIDSQGPGLTWRTPIKNILPDIWALSDECADSQATLVDILSHRSGLPRHDSMYSLNDDTLDIIRRLQFLKPTKGFREEFQYSNLMFMVAAQIIKMQAGDHRSFIENEILGPLDMTSTTFSTRRAKESHHFSQTWDSFSGRQIPFWFPEPAADCMSGPGGIITNVVDMIKWLKKVRSSLTEAEGSPDATPKISKTLKTTTRAHTILQATPQYPEVSIQGYGLAWGRESYRGHDRIGHSGGIPGVSARLAVYPGTGLIIVILVNVDDKMWFNKIIENYLVDRALGLDPISWETRWKYTPAVFDPVTEKPPGLPMAAYAGIYKDEGYGKVTLFLPSDNPDTSCECGQVQASYNKIDAATETKYRWQLQSSWKRLWATDLRLISLGNDIFWGQLGSIFPDGYGADSSPFLAAGSEMVVSFTVEDGKVTGFDICADEELLKDVHPETPDLAKLVSEAHFVKC